MNTIYPKISIVTPNYNKGVYLERTIHSVLSQGYPNLEYIIIDGGSTDTSIEIIKKYENNLAYWVSEPDKGLYHAIKKGFEHATGEIMAWINSDDMYHRYALFVVADIFTSHPEVSWLTGVSTEYDEEDRTVRIFESAYFSHIKFLMHDYKFIQQESTFWRRSLYEKVEGISTDYMLAGDFDLWMRFSRHEKLYVANALIGGFRICASQLSKNISLYFEEAEHIINKEHISREERTVIKRIRLITGITSFLKKVKIFNWQGVYRILMKKHISEEYAHRLFFDFDNKTFKLSMT